MENAADSLDEPIADTGIIGTNIICQKSKSDGVKVLISGTGADELFGGYMRHLSPIFSLLSFYRRFPLFLDFHYQSFYQSLIIFSERISDPFFNYFLSVSGMPPVYFVR